ncbi:LysM peptidoglycan-binding domain-containing protein [Amycolatopsis sp. NBC_00345]|uniref:hypothetical protein n=1 Tax=Amycolatopsis sp. NBC_00345 TaxID=2975955 RepID=UPI002E257EF8
MTKLPAKQNIATESSLTNALQVGRQLIGLGMGDVPASLSPVVTSADSFNGGLPISFSLNPKSVSFTKKNKTESDRGVIATSFQDALKATSNRRLTLGEVYMTGAGITSVVISALVDWATPFKQPISAASAAWLGNANALSELVKTSGANALKDSLGSGGSNSVPARSSTHQASPLARQSKLVYYRLPILRFMWGFGAPLHNCLVNLEGVTVDYQRFDFTGTPVWAKLKLDLVEYSDDPPFTNPTSGGRPGRTKHVVTQGENVMQIANRAYGSPNAWRLVAEANGIDDPLRIKPGRTLALPPVDEAMAEVTS